MLVRISFLTKLYFVTKVTKPVSSVMKNGFVNLTNKFIIQRIKHEIFIIMNVFLDKQHHL